MKPKQLIWVLIVVVAASSGILFFLMTDDVHDHGTELADVYTCRMHPSVRSDRPGACPVCGMALVRETAGGTPAIDTEVLRGISLSPTQRVIANVSTVTAERRSLTRQVDAVGLVTFAEPLRATVAARFRGRIEKLYANVTGERVMRSEPLFELYSPDLISAQREYLLALDQTGETSPGLLGGTESLQRGLLEAARERLSVHYGLTEEQIALLEESGETRNTALFYSPISGTVLQKTVVEGDYVSEGMMLYQLADLSKVWVLLDVYEADIKSVSLGQKVLVSTEVFPGEEFQGEVTFIDPVLDAETRTVKVRTEFDNRNGKLKPNMYVTARITRTYDRVLQVPSQAVLSTGKRNVVWVEVGENLFEPRDVVLGARNSATAEILSGLTEGEMVAATGGYLIDSESALQMPTGMPDPHQGHGVTSSGDAGQAPGYQEEVRIRVRGGFFPRVIRMKKGETTRLNFLREESAECTEEVVLRDFGLRALLPRGENVILEVTPEQSGEFVFSCGMNMIHGKIVVEE